MNNSTMTEFPAGAAGPVITPEPARPASPTLSSSRLFGGGQIVFIEHAGQLYTLRITRENKLLLTK